MEVGQHVAALHLLSDQLELSEGHLVILKVSQRDLKHSALQPIRSDFWKNNPFFSNKKSVILFLFWTDIFFDVSPLVVTHIQLVTSNAVQEK